MGWLIELLLEAIKEKCSQFIIDMMELITSMFTELLSCDLNLFEELFGVVGDLYKNVIVPLGIALLLLICVWQLLKSMFGKMGMNSEDPIELVCRSGVCLFMIAGAKTIVNYILAVAGTPYQWVVGTEIEVDSFSGYVSALEGVTATLGIDSISVTLLMLIMQFVVAWNYLKMLFTIAERYVLLGVFSYTAPLAFSTGGSKATNNILASWVKMFGGQVVLIIMNAWCMKMFLSGYGNMLASGYGFTKFFVATLCLVGFCKITFKMDSYMASLGVNLGRPSNGLGAMGLIMAASRLFGRSGHGASVSAGMSGSSGSSAGTAAAGAAAGAAVQGMAQGMGTPIPMGVEMLGGAGDGDLTEESAGASAESEFGDEMGAQAEDMDELENDNVLEALGEMPEENAEDGMVFDEEGTGEGIPVFEQEENGEERAGEGIPTFEQEENGEQGAGEGIPVFGQEENGEMELEGTEQLSDMPGSEGTEMFNEEGNIDGLGDYPVNRKEEQAEEAETDGEMDLKGTIPTEESGLGEATCGSAGSAFGETGTLSSGGQNGTPRSTDTPTDILEELGGGVTAAPSDLSSDSVSTGESEFLEAASGGMETVTSGGTSESMSGGTEKLAENGENPVQMQGEGNEVRFFESSGEENGLPVQEETWNPGSVAESRQSGTESEEKDGHFAAENEVVSARTEETLDKYSENFYGEIPDVPKSRKDLENLKRNPYDDPDELL